MTPKVSKGMGKSFRFEIGNAAISRKFQQSTSSKECIALQKIKIEYHTDLNLAEIYITRDV